MTRRTIGSALLALPALVAASCSSKTSSGPAYAPPPASVVVDDPGPVKIRREAFMVDGAVPPPNPRGGAGTPPAQNRVRVVRYRVDADPPKPARAIVVMMPGFLAGAGSHDALARAVVRRSAEGDALEAWVIDRRSNLLEDTHGLDVAEVKKDPSIARRYYVEQESVEGKTFDGFLSGAQAPWASEWGIATTIGDLKNVLAKIPERRTRVVLFGHSLGASIVEEYAAWDFAGQPGYMDVAGLVLLDGVARDEGLPQPRLDRATYENGGGTGVLGKTLGVESDIRNGNTFFAFPFLGVKAYVVSEYIAMRARWSPDAVEPDSDRDTLLGVFLGVSPVPKMTNRAALGLAFDDTTCPLSIVAVSCGSAVGPLAPYDSALGGRSLHPSDPSATYAWTEFDRTSPVENSSLDDFARGWYEGPGMNFAEWYFPQRLGLDAQIAATLDIADDDWRATAYGIRAKHGREIDTPILAVALALVKTADAFDNLKKTVRTPSDAFKALAMPELTHVDGIAGADLPGSKVRALYEEIVGFARQRTPAGGVVVPTSP